MRMRRIGNRQVAGEPWRRRDERRLFVRSLEHVRHATLVANNGLHAEMDVASSALLFASDGDFITDLGSRQRPGARPADPAQAVARPQVPLHSVLLRPPCEELGITLRFLLDWPVELGRHVVEPPLLEPQLGVGVKSGVLIESLDAWRIAGSPDAERTDSHL